MKLSFLKFLILIIAICVICKSAEAALVNGNFETPDINGIFVTYDNDPSPAYPFPPPEFGWFLDLSSSGYIDLINSYWSGVSGTTNPDHYDQSVDIDLSTILSQTFTTDVGQPYELSFWYAHNPDQQTAFASADITVKGVGTLLSATLTHNMSSTRSDMHFVKYTDTFTADSATTTLSFQGKKGGLAYPQNHFGFVVDDVKVIPIPEPATLSLLGLGLLGLLGIRKKIKL